VSWQYLFIAFVSNLNTVKSKNNSEVLVDAVSSSLVSSSIKPINRQSFLKIMNE
jgi:hypothetical protein